MKFRITNQAKTHKTKILLIGAVVLMLVVAIAIVVTPFFNVYVACILMMSLQKIKKDLVVFVLKSEIFS